MDRLTLDASILKMDTPTVSQSICIQGYPMQKEINLWKTDENTQVEGWIFHSLTISLLYRPGEDVWYEWDYCALCTPVSQAGEFKKRNKRRI